MKITRYTVFNNGPAPVEVIVKNGRPSHGFGLETGDEIDLDIEPDQLAFVRPMRGRWEWEQITPETPIKNWRGFDQGLLAEVLIDIGWEEVA